MLEEEQNDPKLRLSLTCKALKNCLDRAVLNKVHENHEQILLFTHHEDIDRQLGFKQSFERCHGHTD